MEPIHILLLMAAYFGLLIFVAQFTTKTSDNATFFTGNRQSPWYAVSFGMIGASLSGVTFISVPGWVGASKMAYIQMVMGYMVGYAVVALVLLPLYYRLNLVTIYTYLRSRLGEVSYRTGAWIFFVSRMIGSSFRMFIVANVLQWAVFDSLGIPFWLTTSLTLMLIWVYTFKGGIKTIVWTDTLQTAFMLGAVALTVIILKDQVVPAGESLWSHLVTHENTRIFFFDDAASPNNFWKQFLAGIFITVCMTGLDQDMMQKNLTCKNIGDAQKNMLWFSVTLFFVNVLFLTMGVLLYDFAALEGMQQTADALFPAIALGGYLPWMVGALFITGLIAAAYSSADSALAALTTSFCVDILDIEKLNEKMALSLRRWVHVGMTATMALVIVVFRYTLDDSVISAVFKAAGYTYGPLLGLFALALLTPWQVRSWGVPIAAILSPLITYGLQAHSVEWFGYTFSFELIALNGLIMFLLMVLLAKKAITPSPVTAE